MAKLSLSIGLILLLSLLAAAPAATAQDELRWLPRNIPAQGEAGGWMLAKDSDVQQIAMAADGSLYASVDGLTCTLYKSTDGGLSWQSTGDVTDGIVDIVTAPDDASIIYYATSTSVYKSSDAGKSFAPLGTNPAIYGNTEITTIDVTRYGSSNLIVVGARDTDAGEYGGVYTFSEGQPFAQWLDNKIGSYDVYRVAFSPNFSQDQQIVAVVTDDTGTLVTTKIGGAGWGKAIGDARLKGTTPEPRSWWPIQPISPSPMTIASMR